MVNKYIPILLELGFNKVNNICPYKYKLFYKGYLYEFTFGDIVHWYCYDILKRTVQVNEYCSYNIFEKKFFKIFRNELRLKRIKKVIGIINGYKR